MITEKNNNQVNIAGHVVSEPEYSHEVFGEKFYTFYIEIYRNSGSTDIIPTMISERLIDLNEIYPERTIEVNGQYRSYNRHEDNRNRLVLSVFADEILFPDIISSQLNKINLEGYICKPPVYRRTPLGREIADILLAVNRPYGKSDYIPCICWGRNARYVEGLQVGTRFICTGRIQSRVYEKEGVQRTAYEVSIRSIREVN